MANTEKLIEIIKKYPIIYDLSNEEYKNCRKKDKIWEEVGAELNESGSDNLKKKWKNLRDTYAKYIRTTKTKTGDPAKKLKKWQWAEHLEAFRPYLMFAKTCSNVPDISLEDESDTQNTEISSENIDKEGEKYGEGHSRDLEEKSTNEFEMHCTSNDNLKTVTDTPRRTITNCETNKRRSKAETKPTSSVDSLINYFENKRSNKFDPTDLLFLAHASAVKTFSPRRQAITKMKIGQVIMEQEMLHNEELSSTKFCKTSSRPTTSSSNYSSNSGPPFPIEEYNNYTELTSVTKTSARSPDYQCSNLNSVPEGRSDNSVNFRSPVQAQNYDASAADYYITFQL